MIDFARIAAGGTLIGLALGLRHDGVITEETFEKLVAEVDAALTGKTEWNLAEAALSSEGMSHQ
ncbi:MAG: hypothetical protein HZB51_16410 [Chloroflexi bacterium]|nr:hypothetical protein [Chloroflexota bacterium]